MRVFNNTSFLSFVLILIFGYQAGAQTSTPAGASTAPANTTRKSLNIKLSPAIFWKTAVVEFEYPLTSKITVGLNLLGKLGRTDEAKANAILKNENLVNNGLRAELAAKYYFKNEAPTGFYIQSNVAFGNLIYFDGNVRPYTLHNHWKKPTAEDPKGKLERPFPVSAGIGGGYQLVLLPKHIIGNLMLGVQGNMDQQNNFFVSIYVAPSLGYMF
ncbi:MAG TPA: hypothetical protein VF691_09150 [Cytophagaceae bacterium]|jgi:hypothetical protein